MFLIDRIKTYIKVMDDLEPRPNFYAENGYGDYIKKLLHYATVSILTVFFILHL